MPCNGPCQLFPGSCSSTTVLWNFEDVLQIFHKYNSIVGYIAGHDHSGGYKQDDAGIHYMTLPSPLETEKGDMCFASVDIYDDKMRINCVGKKKWIGCFQRVLCISVKSNEF